MSLQHKYFKAFCTEDTQREDNLAPGFLGMSDAPAFPSTARGVLAHFQGQWCRMKEKYKKLVFRVSYAINCGCTLTWDKCLESHHFKCGFVMSSKWHCFALTFIFVCMLMNVILNFVVCSLSEQR